MFSLVGVSFLMVTQSLGDACIDYLNKYRATVGKSALSGSYSSGCESTDATTDCASGALSWHSSFGTCGESAQCEAWTWTCESAVDSFYNEGPGGGHYDIMMSDSYSYVYWGLHSKCSTASNNFYTFNFYTSSLMLPSMNEPKQFLKFRPEVKLEEQPHPEEQPMMEKPEGAERKSYFYLPEVEKPVGPEQLAEDQSTEDANSIMATLAVCGLLVGAMVAAVVSKRRRGNVRSEPLLEK